MNLANNDNKLVVCCCISLPKQENNWYKIILPEQENSWHKLNKGKFSKKARRKI